MNIPIASRTNMQIKVIPNKSSTKGGVAFCFEHGQCSIVNRPIRQKKTEYVRKKNIILYIFMCPG